MTQIIIPADSPLYQAFQAIGQQRKLAFFAGLPGTGKSLLLKQCALLAEDHGRQVHLLQYDLSRAPFETAALRERYPEIEGVTHPAIRKAVGLWARTAVQQWLEQYPEADHLLLGEVPLIGNRLIELTQPLADDIEPILASEQTLFIIPVPSTAVRQHIESAREKSIANPQHENETKDAPPNVLQGLMQQVSQLAQQLGLVNSEVALKANYDPVLYTAVYQYLLQHRHQQTLPIDTILQPAGSAYDLHISGTELSASPAQAAAIMHNIEQDYTADQLATAVDNWYQV